MADEQNTVLESLNAAVSPPAVATDKKLILMLDTETMGLSPKSVVTQLALYPYDPEEDTVYDNQVIWSFLPLQPQIDAGRVIEADNILWWMTQSDEARAMFDRNTGDSHTLMVLLQHFVHRFRELTKGVDWELWAQGPQFDVPLVENLLRMFQLPVPWEEGMDYRRVRDLRTLVAEAGIDPYSVEKPTGFVKHQAGWDCRYQLRIYREARRHLRARG